MKKIIVYALVIALGIYMTGCGMNEEEDNLFSHEKDADDDIDSNWKQAYIPIVKQWDDMHGNDYEYGYELAYIDDNDVPELVLACDDGAFAAYDVYTCIGDKAVRLEFEDDGIEQGESKFVSPGCQGKGDCYIERTGIYMQGNEMMGFHGVNGYVLEDNLLTNAFNYFYHDNSWDDTISDPYGYRVEYIDNFGEKIINEAVTDGDEKYYDITGAQEAKHIEKIYNCDFKKCQFIDCTMNYKTICFMLGMDDEQ